MSDRLERFLARIPEFGPLVRAVVGADLQMGLQVRETGRRMLIDLASAPIRVTFDPPAFSTGVILRADRADLEALLSGRLDLMQGISQRRLLVAGGMKDLVAVVPLFDLTPVLWAAAANASRTGWLQALVGGLARRAGRGLAGLRRDELLGALQGLAVGAGGPIPGVPARATSTPAAARTNPLDAPPPAGLRRLVGPLAQGGLKLAGWSLATARYRLGLPLDLIETVGRLSEGLDRTGTRAE